MFKNNRLFFWTVEVLLLTLILFIWRQMGSLLSPFFSVAKTFFMPFLLGGFLYYITNPAVTFLEKRLKMKRIWAIVIIFAALISLLVFSITSLIPNLINQLTDLISASQNIYVGLQDLFNEWKDNPAFKNIDINALLKQFNLSYVDILENVLNSVTVSVSSIVFMITNTVMILILTPVILFYLLKDGEGLLPMLERSILKNDTHDISKLMGQMNKTISRYISGVAIDAAFIFVFALIGYHFMGIQYAFLFALVAGVTNVVPYVGPYLGLTPVILAYVVSDPKKMIIAIIYIMTLQQIDGNIVYPRVVGSTMKIHPLTIMVLLVLGGNIAGLVGMLVAVPAYAIIKEIVKFIAGVYEYHKKNKIVL
ncbi:AI-2E family transporter [Streptococcus ratti]|uniref:AI-2E family transporter n=2 Tax=Streptococcus ratti TaxID=1341 RepID=A0A7X9LBV8_STRRT|nr:AI-2E family transporter [Streptococcus ratti]VEI59657.1 permease [Streptococcus mutans]EJN93327.1 putative permease [Streptococcus ratti FA-1 = DSM 20564]EMP67626.1 putative permease [Streptococcus ratti FA-1 = DSM 20564]NMD48285.1 AI-2E family transporter [Streptococcus ratti]QEY07224.1 AI-2E family transporter [Streptococcus ratti]